MGTQLNAIGVDVEALHRRLKLCRGEILRVRRELLEAWTKDRSPDWIAMRKGQLESFLKDERALEQQIKDAQFQASKVRR